MGFIRDFLANTREPRGFLGKLMLGAMNMEHAKIADWGMEHIKGFVPKSILDCGCGGGRNIRVLLERFPDAVGCGLDYSDVAVEKSRQVNEKTIAAGRCTVVKGDVAALPLEEGSFDLVTAFETVYFWPGLENCFKQVFRVLKPGGLFLIVNELDGTCAIGEKFQKLIDGMALYKENNLADALKEAGFTDIYTNCHAKKHWLTVIGKRPGGAV